MEIGLDVDDWHRGELYFVPNAGVGVGVASCPQRGSRRRAVCTRLVLCAVGSGVGGGLVFDREGAVAGLVVENQSGGEEEEEEGGGGRRRRRLAWLAVSPAEPAARCRANSIWCCEGACINGQEGKVP